MSAKILCVDDEENVLSGLQRTLRKQFSLDTALGGLAGLQRLERDGPYAVVLADMQMPEMSGVEFLKGVEDRWPNVVRIMLTGNADQKTTVEAVNQGHVFRFLNKPCEPELLAATLHAALRQHELATAERELLEKTVNGAIKALVDILSLVDPRSFGRVQILRECVRAAARAMGLENTWEVEAAAMLSKAGCVALPPQLLLKTRAGLALTPAEQLTLERVPEISRNLVANIPRLEGVAQMVYYAQKRFDGSGFPADPICGESIPLGARLLKALSDLLELEEEGTPRSVALQHLLARPGWYDPNVLDAAVDTLPCQGVSADPQPGAKLAIALRDLRVDDRLAADAIGADGSMLLEAGQVVTQSRWERLLGEAETGGVMEPLYITKEV